MDSVYALNGCSCSVLLVEKVIFTERANEKIERTSFFGAPDLDIVHSASNEWRGAFDRMPSRKYVVCFFLCVFSCCVSDLFYILMNFLSFSSLVESLTLVCFQH